MGAQFGSKICIHVFSICLDRKFLFLAKTSAMAWIHYRASHKRPACVVCIYAVVIQFVRTNGQIYTAWKCSSVIVVSKLCLSFMLIIIATCWLDLCRFRYNCFASFFPQYFLSLLYALSFSLALPSFSHALISSSFFIAQNWCLAYCFWSAYSACVDIESES